MWSIFFVLRRIRSRHRVFFCKCSEYRSYPVFGQQHENEAEEKEQEEEEQAREQAKEKVKGKEKERKKNGLGSKSNGEFALVMVDS
jgi:hypothetical protein